MRNILSIAFKDLRLLWRDKFGMFWVIVFPLMMAIFFGSLMSGMRQQSPVRIAVLDDDNSKLSQRFVANLQESTAVEFAKPLNPRTESKPPVTKAAKEASADTSDQGQQSIDVLRAQVQSGQLAAYVYLQPGFGETGFVPNAGKVEIGVDPARRVEAGLLQGVVMEAVFAPMRELFSQPEKMKEQAAVAREQISKADGLALDERLALTGLLAAVDLLADKMQPKPGDSKPSLAVNAPFGSGKPQMVEISANRDGPTSGYEISFPQSITWGIFGCVSAFAMSLVTERVFGTYLRLRVAPVSRAQILAGKGLACFLACCLVSVFLLALGRLVFGVRVLDPFKLALAIASSSACFVGLMMFTSVMGRTERAVAGSVWAILMPLAMLGGSMVPQIAMPRWMQTAGSVSPVKWAIRAIEGGIWRDLPWAEMWTASAVLLTMGAVFYAVGLILLLRSDA